MASINAQLNMPVATLQMDSSNSCQSSKRQESDAIDDEKNDKDDENASPGTDELPISATVDDDKPSDRIQTMNDERSMSPQSQRLDQQNPLTISNVDKRNVYSNSTVDSNNKFDSDAANDTVDVGVALCDANASPSTSSQALRDNDNDTNSSRESRAFDNNSSRELRDADNVNDVKSRDSIEVDSDVERRNINDNRDDSIPQHTNASMFESNYDDPNKITELGKYEKQEDLPPPPAEHQMNHHHQQQQQQQQQQQHQQHMNMAEQHMSLEEQQRRCDAFQQQQEQEHHLHMQHQAQQYQSQSNSHESDQQQQQQMHNAYQEQMFQQQQQQHYHHQNSNMSHHYSQMHHDEDPHNQFKMYSSMYSMPQGNGFCGNPYGNNSNKLLSQQSNQQQSVAAPFKPYKLASPTSSTKHSNLSSGPSTPNTVTGNAIDDVYDMTNSASMNPSSVPPNSNANAGGGGPMSHDDLMHMRHDYQQQQQQRNDSPATEDPYNFVDDDMHSMSPHQNHMGNNFGLALQQMGRIGYPPISSHMRNNETAATVNMKNTMLPSMHSPMDTSPAIVNESAPKKRGRKKKVREDKEDWSLFGPTAVPKPLPAPKERKKHDRFNGMSEEEVSKRTLPDHLTNNLDIIIIGINPGLFAAYKGHHYAGPGNHFWKCLYLSGLTHEQMSAEEDYKLLDFGIGFTNMVQRATKGSADLTRKEIKEGSRLLQDKLKQFRPKIAVFNGKLIFEVFSGKKDFNFGRQPECIEGTNTYMWVMPSSSARCAQLPRAADKVPFYAALKKFRDYLNGAISHIDDSECVFTDPKFKACYETDAGPATTAIVKSEPLPSVTSFTTNPATNPMGILSGQMTGLLSQQHQQPQPPSDITDISNNMNDMSGVGGGGGGGGVLMNDMPGKKKRGRPKKIRGEGDENIKVSTPRRQPNVANVAHDMLNGEVQKKKRGRPKKVKFDQSTGELMPSTKMSATNPSGLLENSIHMNTSSNSNNENIHGTGADTPESVMFSSPSSMNKQCSSLVPPSPQQQSQQHQSIHPFASPSSSSNGLPGAQFNHLNSRDDMFDHRDLPHNHNLKDTTRLNMRDDRLESLNNPDFYHRHNHQQQTASESPQQFSHYDLSSEISAAISSAEHSAGAGSGQINSPPSNSQIMNPGDYQQSATTTLTSKPNHVPSQVERTTPTDVAMDHASLMARSTPNADVGMDHASLLASQIHHQNSNINYSPYRNAQQHQQPTHQQQMHLPNQAHQQHHQHAFQSTHHMHHAPQQNVEDMYGPGGSSVGTAAGKLASTDVTSKSLSGLESLVDQIPSLGDTSVDAATSVQSSNVHSLNLLRGSSSSSIAESRINDLTPLTGIEQYQSSCLYSSNYASANATPNLGSSMLANGNEIPCNGIGNRARSSDSHLTRSMTPSAMMYSAALPTNATVLHSPSSPHTHTPPTMNNNQSNNSFNSLSNPFSVSNLTAVGNHSYTPTPPPPTPSSASDDNRRHAVTCSTATYRRVSTPIDAYSRPNLQQPPQQTAMYIDPQLPMVNSNLMPAMYIDSQLPMVNSIFSPHAYGQHHHPGYSGYGSAQHIQQQQPNPFGTSIHMPSPNYPYGYNAATAGYGHHQSTVPGHHHPAAAHAAAAAYHSMFRPDISGFGAGYS